MCLWRLSQVQPKDTALNTTLLTQLATAKAADNHVQLGQPELVILLSLCSVSQAIWEYALTRIERQSKFIYSPLSQALIKHSCRQCIS